MITRGIAVYSTIVDSKPYSYCVRAAWERIRYEYLRTDARTGRMNRVQSRAGSTTGG